MSAKRRASLKNQKKEEPFDNFDTDVHLQL